MTASESDLKKQDDEQIVEEAPNDADAEAVDRKQAAEDLIDQLSEAGSSESTPADAGEAGQMTPEQLAAALAESRQQVGELQDGFLRAKAEMENIRRRSQNEVVAARKYAVEGFAQELLTVKDSLDQASQVELEEGSSEAVAKMKEGLELTLKQLDSVLAKFAITEVEAGPGVKFDPEVHQAISMVDSKDQPSNHIIEVMQRGFMLKDRLLRPAMVVVAS